MLDEVDQEGIEAAGAPVVEIEIDVLASEVRDQRLGGVPLNEKRRSGGIDQVALAGLDIEREAQAVARSFLDGSVLGVSCPIAVVWADRKLLAINATTSTRKRRGAVAGLRARSCRRCRYSPTSRQGHDSKTRTQSSNPELLVPGCGRNRRGPIA
jgi:hypothetical protein